VNLGLAAIVAAAFVAAHLTGVIGAKPGDLTDSDCYVHLLRAERLWETGRWYDPVLERSNTPYGGEELHWTRPFDVLLLLGGVPASAFVGLRPGLFWWGVIVSPVLLAVTLVILPWAVRPLLRGDGALIASLILVCQLGTWLVFQAGRPDHHSLLTLLFIIALGFTLRLIEHPYDPGICHGAGIVAALSLWASIESLLVVAISFVALAILWVARGQDYSRKALHYGAALLGGLVVAVLIERPPANLGAAEFDRLSIVHCEVFAFVVLVWAAIVVWDRRAGSVYGRTGRVLALASGAAVCAGLIAVVVPGWYKGPFANVDAQVIRVYVQNVAEMKPLVASGPGRSLAATVLGTTLISAPLLFRRAVRGPHVAGWLYLTGLLMAFNLLAFLQIRWAPYLGVLLSIPLTGIVLAAWARLDRRPYTFKRTLAKSGVLVACCYFLLFFGLVFDAIRGAKPENDRDDHPPLAPICRYLAEAPPYAGHRLRVLADVFWGGEILYRTGHEVVGTPYHRNTQGILDTYRAFSAATDEQALGVIRERGINAVLIAPGSDRIRHYYGGDQAGSTFYRRLCDGAIPAWCYPVHLPADLDAFRLFEIHLQ
jgi:hypothetical protein